jgi:hypothetical protein
MVVYAPGTQEKDHQKQNMALQEHARQIDVSTASIATNTTNIATNTTNITALQTVAAHLAAPLTNSLGADVLLNDTTKYFDGPSVAQGTSGIFFASGTVTVFDSSTAAIRAILWDGTTVIASTEMVILSTETVNPMSLSGCITNPAANIRISVKDISNTSGKILYNITGASKDSTLTVIQLG